MQLKLATVLTVLIVTIAGSRGQGGRRKGRSGNNHHGVQTQQQQWWGQQDGYPVNNEGGDNLDSGSDYSIPFPPNNNNYFDGDEDTLMPNPTPQAPFQLPPFTFPKNFNPYGIMPTTQIVPPAQPQINQSPSHSHTLTHRGSSRTSSISASRKTKDKTSIIMVGEICDPTDAVYNKCVSNSACVLNPGDGLYRCTCSHSYEATLAKKCLRSWGNYCDTKEPCNQESFLSCVDNRCDCANSPVYQTPGEKCRSRVGGPCSSAGPDCVPHANCQSFGRSSRCVCKEGYVETLSGLCLPGLGMPCHGKGECNSEVPLVCKEGICACREAIHTYDTESNSCVGLVGAQCCTNFEGVDCPLGVTNGCIFGAFCKKTSRNLPGRCACQSYNLEGEDRTCGPNPTLDQLSGGSG